MARLHLLTEFIQGALQFGGGSPAAMRDVEEQRKEAVMDILNLAWNCKVRCGKVRSWTFFSDLLMKNEGS